jgi:hypothetical protein
MALLGNNSFDIGNSKLNYTYSMNLLIDLFFKNDFTFTLEKKNLKKNLKSCFKFMILTKKFKEKN